MVWSWQMKQKTSLVAVDFGSCSLRAVQLRKHNGGWGLAHWVNLEHELTAPDPTPPHGPGELHAVFGPGTFLGADTAMAMSPPDVEYQILDVPAVVLQQPAEQLRSALELALNQQMSWPAAEAEIAAWSIKPATSGKTSVIVAAARRSVLNERLDRLGSQRLLCRRADIAPNAFIHLLAKSTDHADTSVWGVLDLGFHSSRLYLMQGDRPVYARVLRQGGKELTETLVGSLHLDFATAERYKRTFGIRKTAGRGFRSGLGGLANISQEQMPGVLYAILAPAIEALAHDIERSYQFVLTQFADCSAGTLYLVGGGARLTGLIEALGPHLGVSIRLPEAGALITCCPDWREDPRHPALKPEQFCVLASCIGLTLREVQP